MQPVRVQSRQGADSVRIGRGQLRKGVKQLAAQSEVLSLIHICKCVNILDTPGHQDFSEDTYRTLMAADSAVMVIDAAKGVEAQTIKLFKVCTLRHIPIFTFINKICLLYTSQDLFFFCFRHGVFLLTYSSSWGPAPRADHPPRG